ncbi:GGDEF domain-containing protein [Roseateles violae]|uniref:diguanylate cyclase n=1 Tax=Roseateles violae TaxID=3058042 RepID=A0ABT8DZX9_9BURK|nr:GGDEF domain-containing protein [Pelomonas sp. PFR6]MDN3923138.1 GGDEF domain-containing protein [Pelomonas sp. PFR6]
MSLIRLLRIVALLLVVVTVALLALLTGGALHELERSSRALAAVEELRLALLVAEKASRERGPSNGWLGEPLPHTAPARQRLDEARGKTDAAFAALLVRPDSVVPDREPQLARARLALEQARQQIDRVAAEPLAQRSSEAIAACVQAMVAVIRQLAPLVSQLANEAQNDYPPIGDPLQAARLSAELREYAGLLGSHFTAALAAGRPMTRAELDAVQHTRGRIDQLRFLISVRLARPQSGTPTAELWERAQQRYFGTALPLAEQVITASQAGQAHALSPAAFAEAYVPDMNSILEVRDALLEQSLDGARAARREALGLLGLVLIGAVAMVAGLVGLLLLVRRRVLGPLAAIAQAVDELAANRPLTTLTPLPQAPAEDGLAALIQAVRALQERTQRLALEKERDSLIEQLRSQSNTDALTGLLNRRGVFEAGEHLLEQARRHGFGVTAILLDVDHFKRFNDELGHAGGDAALLEVAEVIRAQMRRSDLAGRLGGEEFILLLSHCELELSERFAERMRSELEQLPPRAQGLALTASFGVAGFPGHGASLDELISRADKAMYRAKTAGRNQAMTVSA